MTFNPLLLGSIQESGAGAALMTYSTTGSPTTRTHGSYTSLEFTSSGSFTLLTNPNSLTFDILVIAGAGSAGVGGE